MSMYVGEINKHDVDIILNLNEIIFHDQIKYSRDYITKICEQGKGFIIRLNNVPIGHVFCDYHNNEIVKEVVPTIMSIGVLEEFRKLGFGRTLLRSALELYPGEDIYLNVRGKNRNAQDLYTSEGFVVIGNIKKYYRLATGDEDAYVMVRFHEVDQMLL